MKESEVAKLCLTLCNPTDGSLPGSSIHGIFQARKLEWVAIAFCRRSSWPGDWPRISRIADRRFTFWATGEAAGPPGKSKLSLLLTIIIEYGIS